MGNKKIILTLVGLAVIFLIGFILSTKYELFGLYEKKKFNPIEWNTNSTNRKKMLDDLIEKKILVGKKKEQVIEAIGNDFKGEFKGESWTYYIEVKDGYPDASITLLDIEFKDDLVSNVSKRKYN
jgi:hypothetical protein